MTPEQALDLLDHLAKQSRLSRDEHLVAAQAVHALRAVLQPKAE